MPFIIILVVMFGVMYFLMIRPQRAKQRAAQDLLSRVAPGDEVITVGGIYADVIEVDADKVVLEIAEDVHIEVARKAIAQIIPPETGSVVEEDGEEEPESDKKKWSAFGKPGAANEAETEVEKHSR